MQKLIILDENRVFFQDFSRQTLLQWLFLAITTCSRLGDRMMMVQEDDGDTE